MIQLRMSRKTPPSRGARLNGFWKVSLFYALLTTFCILSPLAHATENVAPDSSDFDAIQTDVVPTSQWGVVKTKTTAVIQAPLDRVWAEITNYEHLTVGIPNVLSEKDLENDKKTVFVHFVLVFPWPMRNKDLTLAFTEDKANYHIEWHKVDGSLRDHKGELTLQSWGEKYTLLTLGLEQDTGFFVPDFLVRHSIQKKIPNEVWRVRLNLK